MSKSWKSNQMKACLGQTHFWRLPLSPPGLHASSLRLGRSGGSNRIIMHRPCFQGTRYSMKELKLWLHSTGKDAQERAERRREITFGHLGGSLQLGLEGLEAWEGFGHGEGQATRRGRWAFSCRVKASGSQKARLLSLGVLLPTWLVQSRSWASCNHPYLGVSGSDCLE